MAYDKQDIIDKALQVIEQENCTRLSEVFLHIPISEATLYTWDLEYLDKIKAKIEEQKVRVKAKMKRKWIDSDVPALAIAAFKLIASEDEADALNTSKVNSSNTHEFKNKPTINISFAEDSKG
jgi:hypothetical protein